MRRRNGRPPIKPEPLASKLMLMPYTRANTAGAGARIRMVLVHLGVA